MLDFIKKLLPHHGEPAVHDEYAAMVAREKARYDSVENVHELPDIFHYWSNTFVAPELRTFGYATPNDLFEKRIEARCLADHGHTVTIFSPGAGNCDLEAQLAKNLVERKITNFRIDCLDINEAMLKRGRAHARSMDVARHIGLVEGDFNHWRGEPGAYDVVIANQSLHHVLELEHLFDAIHDALTDDGLFLISDMIGRNGHLRWPEALEAMQPFWEEMPPGYRYNQLLQRDEQTYINHDCSTHDFEGIRAQDILPLLCERFGFEFFFPYGNIIFPFIDRPFGHNFHANHDFDRHFIDRVHARDEQGILSGELTPTSMMAITTKGSPEPLLRDPRLKPRACVRQA